MRSLYALTLIAVLAGCGGGTDEPEYVPTPRVVHMHGDSITYLAKQTITQYLPGYSVYNHGVPGARADQLPTPVWDKEAIYTFSYGANECLQHVPASRYRAALERILSSAPVGQRIVLEAPWLLTNPMCSPYIEQYRVVVVELSVKYSIPLAELDMNRDHDRGGIHLEAPHTAHRANLLANEIRKL